MAEGTRPSGARRVKASDKADRGVHGRRPASSKRVSEELQGYAARHTQAFLPPRVYAVKPSIHGGGGRRFHFDCPCGTQIVTNRKSVTYSNCGKCMEVRRVRTRRQRPRHIEPDYHQLFASMTPPQRTGHPLESPDYNERYLRLGFLFLLAPLWVPLLWMLLSPVFAPLTPAEDRPHHYERHDIHFVDTLGGVHTIPTWKRVDD